MAKKAASTKSRCRVTGDSKDKCTTVVTHKLIKLEENKRKVVFRNPGQKEHSLTKVDGCLINEGPRSDYLITEKGTASLLVELKGTDVEHACAQLFSAVDHKDLKPLLENRVGFIIICSKYPRFDTFVAKAKTVAARRFKTGFHVLCDQRELEIGKAIEIDGPH